MRVLVCGGRDFDLQDVVNYVLWGLHRQVGITQIIEGGANGADKCAKIWALSQAGIDVRTFRANWAKGRDAGFERNERMLQEGRPEFGIAFPGGSGTADMVSRLRQAKIPGARIVYNPENGQWVLSPW